MKILLQVGQTNEDRSGKKTFKIKEEMLGMYDPYLYVTEKHITSANAEYAHH